MGFLQQRYTETGKMQNDNRVFFQSATEKEITSAPSLYRHSQRSVFTQKHDVTAIKVQVEN